MIIVAVLIVINIFMVGMFVNCCFACLIITCGVIEDFVVNGNHKHCGVIVADDFITR
jgi:hypothetical protein